MAVEKATYCEDCKYCRVKSTRVRIQCRHPELLDRASKSPQRCESLRTNGMECGKHGAGFEVKTEETS